MSSNDTLDKCLEIFDTFLIIKITKLRIGMIRLPIILIFFQNDMLCSGRVYRICVRYSE